MLILSSWRLPAAENELLEAPNAVYKLLGGRPEAPGGAKEAARRTKKRLWAHSCSEINDFKGDRGSRSAVKSGRAEAPGR